jgi:hypothetical protein
MKLYNTIHNYIKYNIYATKVWLSSVLITPFLILYSDFKISSLDNLLSYFIYSCVGIIIGFVLSIPSWILLNWAVSKVKKYTKYNRKLLIQIIVVGLTLVLFSFFLQKASWNWRQRDFNLVGVYIITLSFGVWYYKI